MRTSDRRQLLTVAAALLTLSACAGAAISPSVAPAAEGSGTKQTLGSRIENNAARPTAFISDWNNHAVYIIRQGQLAATLAVDGPAGIALDTSHNLYVANDAGSNVLVYAPPYDATPTTLNDPGFRPNGVAVDRNGNVAVTSFESNSYGPGSVAFYAKGATSPTKTIVANGKFAGDYYCAFDANGNLYLDSKNGSGPFEAGEVVGGINGNKVEALTTNNLVQYPGGMQVTRSGKIAILDQGTGSGTPTIYSYDPPRHGSLGSPVATTPLAQSNNALAFAFEDRRDRYVLTADTFFTAPGKKRVKHDHEDQFGQTQLFNYPSGGMITSVRLAYGAILVGVAIDPPQTS